MAFDREARLTELREMDPNGMFSDVRKQRIVDKEELEGLIEALPDHTEEACDLKNVLRRMAELIRA